MENRCLFGLLIAGLLILAGCTTQYVCPSGETVANPEDCFSEENETEESAALGGECGNDFDCFIEAAESCEEATMTREMSVSQFGIITTATNSMEVRGMENGKCVYYQKTIKSEVTFSEEFREQLREGGATQAEIDAQLAQANQSAQTTVGYEVTCKFEPEELAAMLERWKEGEYSMADLAGCEKEMPETGLQEEAEEETGEEEPEEEIVCVPAAGEGSYVELGIYSTYEITRGGGMMYGNAKVGDTIESPFGPAFTIEEIVVGGGTCESCESEPENVQTIEAKIVASGLLDDAETEYYAEDGDTIFFCSSWDSYEEACEEHARLHIFDVHEELVCKENNTN